MSSTTAICPNVRVYFEGQDGERYFKDMRFESAVKRQNPEAPLDSAWVEYDEFWGGPFDTDWARNMKAVCRLAGIPYFFKQVDKVLPIPEDLHIREFPVYHSIWPCK